MSRNSAGGWGPARARNEGLARVTAALVAFLDSDDLLLPSALALLGAALEAHPRAPFAFGRCLLARHEDAAGWGVLGEMGPDREELRTPLPSLFARNFVPSTGTVVRTEAAREIGGYPTATVFAEDHYFWILLAGLADPVFVPELTALYRIHPGNRHRPERAEAELEQFLALAAEDARLTPALADRLGVSLAESVAPALREGKAGRALAALRLNLLSRPEKLAILRRAARHLRDRRRRDKAGRAASSKDEALRAWLADH